MITITSASDLHKGHPRINPAYLSRSYKKMLEPYLIKSDIFFVVGDYFDRAISLADPRSCDIMEFTHWLLMLLNKHNVTVRFLQGTFSHDRIQMNHIEGAHRNFGLTNDLKFVDKIDLEELPNGLKILYIPDDLPHKNSDAVMDVVWEMMNQRGWKEVDYALVHGSFDFAGFGGHAPPRVCFRPDQFDFVKRKVLVGHIHTPYAKGNVAYHGSPERFSQGEEEKKGFFYIEDNYPEKVKLTFVENKDATWFKTFDDTDVAVATILPLWEERFTTAPEGRHTYFRMKHPDPGIRAAVTKLSRNYENIIFTAMAVDDKTSTNPVGDLNTDKFVLDRIPTPQTLPTDIIDYLKDRGIATTLTPEKVSEYLGTNR